jgi:N-acetylated-alpha-linked acidic dipeptidase
LADSPEAVRGFAPAAVPQERKWEEKARGIPDPARISRYLQHMSRKPHLAGTPASKAVAEYALGLMKEWGLDAHLEAYESLLPTPRVRLLEMVSPRLVRAKLAEPPISIDPSTFDRDNTPPYNAFSGSGDITAPLVYANYGMPGDYEYLAKNGIDVKGKIVITRYGAGWRGLKPRLAAEHGALGCLIYSDPKDDGYYKGDVYPKGMWRPKDGVQRGSVVDMTLYPGDPLSPGWASEKGSKRLPLSEARTLMKIPVLPISYGDALPLLEELGGPVAPEDWRGALGITYHIGDGAEKVRLDVEMDNSTRPLYDVVARIPGQDLADEWVLAGNHHDAWVDGAMDPLSGASALLETARTLAELYKQGWRPRRTILIALWDGEEFGLIGSTEFAEKHADELSRKLVAYINSDSSGKGQLGAGGSHTLEGFVKELAQDVNDPETGKPLAENMRSHSTAQTGRDAPEKPATGPREWHMEALGSGSDYTSFLQHLGIASLNLGFGNENGTGGIYHSAYDTFYWYSHFSDTGFVYEKTLSTVTGLALLRMADATVVPFQFTAFAQSVGRYADEIEALEKTGRKIELTGLRAEIKSLQASSASFENAYERALPRLDGAPAGELVALNELLFQSERHMLLESGLPRREWFKHAIYAPGSLTGYGVKTLPGIREAVEAGHWDEAQQQAARVEDVLKSVNEQIQQASRILNGL